MRREILLLLDYHGRFYLSIDESGNCRGMDLAEISRLLTGQGFTVTIKSFPQIDLAQDYSHAYLLYQSSEDNLLLYKSYIEDIVLGLQERGAILIPPFRYLRAHHNKVFMEILRQGFKEASLRVPAARWYGTLEEAEGQSFDYPVVIKRARGWGGVGVEKADGEKELLDKLPEISWSSTRAEARKELRRRRKDRHEYEPESLYRDKFIIQQFIPGLDGIYETLAFGKKYYVVARKNHQDDFRARGGGPCTYARGEDYSSLLGFAKLVKDELAVPCCALDIGFDGTRHYLIEFQCLRFSPLPLQRSHGFYLDRNDAWQWIEQKSTLEAEFCQAVAEHLARLSPEEL